MQSPRVDLDAATEGQRAPYLFDTKTAAEAVECPPNKFCDWWLRTDRKLRALAKTPSQRAALAAHLIRIMHEYGEEPRQPK